LSLLVLSNEFVEENNIYVQYYNMIVLKKFEFGADVVKNDPQNTDSAIH